MIERTQSKDRIIQDIMEAVRPTLEETLAEERQKWKK